MEYFVRFYVGDSPLLHEEKLAAQDKEDAISRLLAEQDECEVIEVHSIQ